MEVKNDQNEKKRVKLEERKIKKMCQNLIENQNRAYEQEKLKRFLIYIQSKWKTNIKDWRDVVQIENPLMHIQLKPLMD